VQACPLLLLHAPEASQVPAQWPDGSAAPVTDAQVFDVVQCWQIAQSLSALHPPTVQTPVTQFAPETHWLLPVQLVAQAVAAQTNSPQPWMTAAGQLPFPSQLAANVCMPAEQVAARQLVDEPGKTHDVDEPVQVLAQVPLPVQLP